MKSWLRRRIALFSGRNSLNDNRRGARKPLLAYAQLAGNFYANFSTAHSNSLPVHTVEEATELRFNKHFNEFQENAKNARKYCVGEGARINFENFKLSFRLHCRAWVDCKRIFCTIILRVLNNVNGYARVR